MIDIKSCANRLEDEDTTLDVSCPVNEEYCCILEELLPALEKATSIIPRLGVYVPAEQGEQLKIMTESVNETRSLLPCEFCSRPAEQFMKKLNGIRLGKLERKLLTSVPALNEEPCTLEDGFGDRSAREALLRAARKLSKAGLLVLYYGFMRRQTNKWARLEWKKDEEGWAQWGYKVHRLYKVMIFRRTLLGQAVVAHVKEIYDGSPIRWHRYISLLIEAVQSPIEDLLKRFQDSLHGEFDARMIMAMTGCRTKTNGIENMQEALRRYYNPDEPEQPHGSECPRCKRHVNGLQHWGDPKKGLCQQCQRELQEAYFKEAGNDGL